MNIVHAARCAATTFGVLALAGCATFSADGGFDAVKAATAARIGPADQPPTVSRTRADDPALRSRIGALLAQPLSPADAVQIALLNNRGLQATYFQLGIAEADLVQAGRLPNPGFDFKRSAGGGDTVIERTFTASLVGVITAPLATRIETRRFRQTQLMVADAAYQVAAATRKAWFEAVAAEQGVVYAQRVDTAARAGADLADRMAAVGNFSALDRARERAFQAEAANAVVRARRNAVASREALTRLLGLTPTDAPIRLPDRLPDLPHASPDATATATATARAGTNTNDTTDIALDAPTLDDRLDIQAARLEAAQTAAALGLTESTRFASLVDLGYVRDSATGTPGASGYELTIEIPLFDWGTARTARAEAIYMASVDRLAAAVVKAGSEMRESRAHLRGAYELARRYRDEIVPLRKQIADETLLRYNGMLVSVFDLLADAREQALAVNGAIDALKDYWLAEADVATASGGRLGADAPALPSEIVPTPPSDATSAPPSPSASPSQPSTTAGPASAHHPMHIDMTTSPTGARP